MEDFPDTLPPDAPLQMRTMDEVATPLTPIAAAPLSKWSLRDWLKAGQGIAFFRPVSVGARQISALQFFVLLCLLLLIPVGIARFEVNGAAIFNLRGLLLSWITMSIMAVFTWLVLESEAKRPEKALEDSTLAPHSGAHLGTFLGILYAASIPLILTSALLIVLAMRLPELSTNPWLPWLVYWASWLVFAWGAVITYRMGKLFQISYRAIAILVIGSVGISLIYGFTVHERIWQVDYAEQSINEPPRMRLSQDLFEHQSTLLQTQLNALAPHRAGMRDLYALVFAPYASENVFINESRMVGSVLTERFDAKDRLVQLVNHASTTASVAWATPLNLQRSIDAIAQKMDKENDVFLLYMTSHGANDFKLAASHWPLEVDPLTPANLANMLNNAGIRYRVLIISACYSGGWIPPLANDYSLVMTAADATHTSYGCGKKSDLTYFGKAFFAEQLRNTFSFEEAFKNAVPVIEKREKDAGKTDGFSNPQISVGAQVNSALSELSQRLAQLPKQP
jgi:Peptidase C13 family